MKKIIIAGGGISGLTARYYLSKKYPEAEITLYEKSDRLGGCVQSEKKSFFFEKGPRTFRASRSDELIKLIKELQIEEEIVYSSKESQRRYLLKDQKLQPLRKVMLKMIPALLKEWRQPYPWGEDESIETFVKRRLGSYAAETLFDPLTLGIFAGDMRKLSIRSCFPELKALEMEYGSLTKGLFKSKKKGKLKGLFTLKGGLNLLTQKLAEKGRGEIHLNTPLESIQEGVDLTVLALPLEAMRPLLRFDSEATTFFENLSSVNLTVVNVAFKQPVLKQKGFGYLISSNQGEEVLGVVFDSCVFPEQNQEEKEVRLTVMLGGAFHPQHDPANAREKALAALRSHLGITASPVYCHVTHYPSAIPEYLVGHQERVEQFETAFQKRYPHITCIGNYLHGVSINDCVRLSMQI